jgi:hypothetical protein
MQLRRTSSHVYNCRYDGLFAAADAAMSVQPEASMKNLMDQTEATFATAIATAFFVCLSNFEFNCRTTQRRLDHGSHLLYPRTVSSTSNPLRPTTAC